MHTINRLAVTLIFCMAATAVAQTERELEERTTVAKPVDATSINAQALRQRLATVHAARSAPPSSSWRAVAQRGELTLEEDGSYWRLSSPQYVLVVEKATGMLHQFVSRQPTPRDILPPTANGLVVYAMNRSTQTVQVANALKSVQTGAEDDAVRITCTVGFDKPSETFPEATVEYILTPDRVDINISMTAAQEDQASYEIGVLQRYRPQDWQHQVFIGAIDLGRDPISSARQLRYANSVDDITPGTIWVDYGSTSYPQIAFEGSDRYFMFGMLDLAPYAIFVPNYLEQDYGPAMIVTPRRVRHDQTFTFNLFYKCFPRPEQTYPDALTWYLRHVYSTNPLSKGIVRLPDDLKPRTLTAPGGLTFAWPRFPVPGSFPDSLSPELASDASFHDAFEDMCQEMQLTHLWAAGGRVHERYPEAGTEAAKLLDENIRHLQSGGLKVYLYCRQLYRLSDVFDDKPPYRHWLAQGADGKPVPYDPGNPQNEWYFGDFANPEFVQWYINEVKRSVDLYRPDGVAWDMAWSDNVFGPCVNGGLHHGILRVLHDIYVWLEAEHPEMRVIGNGSRAQPTQMYMHALLYEGGYAVESTADCCKIFKNTLLNVEYAERFKEDGPAAHIQSVMRHLAYGAAFGDRGYTMFTYTGSLRDAWDARTGGLLETSMYFRPLKDLAAFSALTTVTPILTRRGAMSIHPADQGVVGTAWVNSERVLVAAFNESSDDRRVAVRLNREDLREAGVPDTRPLTITVLGQNGQPTSSQDWRMSPGGGDVVVSGLLPARHLLLIRSGE
jgi:hypothetical protein